MTPPAVILSALTQNTPRAITLKFNLGSRILFPPLLCTAFPIWLLLARPATQTMDQERYNGFPRSIHGNRSKYRITHNRQHRLAAGVARIRRRNFPQSRWPEPRPEIRHSRYPIRH